MGTDLVFKTFPLSHALISHPKIQLKKKLNIVKIQLSFFQEAKYGWRVELSHTFSKKQKQPLE